jgi:hypothetical protein
MNSLLDTELPYDNGTIRGIDSDGHKICRQSIPREILPALLCQSKTFCQWWRRRNRRQWRTQRRRGSGADVNGGIGGNDGHRSVCGSGAIFGPTRTGGNMQAGGNNVGVQDTIVDRTTAVKILLSALNGTSDNQHLISFFLFPHLSQKVSRSGNQFSRFDRTEAASQL